MIAAFPVYLPQQFITSLNKIYNFYVFSAELLKINVKDAKLLVIYYRLNKPKDKNINQLKTTFSATFFPQNKNIRN